MPEFGWEIVAIRGKFGHFLTSRFCGGLFVRLEGSRGGGLVPDHTENRQKGRGRGGTGTHRASNSGSRVYPADSSGPAAFLSFYHCATTVACCPPHSHTAFQPHSPGPPPGAPSVCMRRPDGPGTATHALLYSVANCNVYEPHTILPRNDACHTCRLISRFEIAIVLSQRDNPPK